MKNIVTMIAILSTIVIILALGLGLAIAAIMKKKAVIEKHTSAETTGRWGCTGKCIDCEAQFIDKNQEWRGGANKCYDCEKDLVYRTGNGFGAMKTKCFSC